MLYALYMYYKCLHSYIDCISTPLRWSASRCHHGRSATGSQNEHCSTTHYNLALCSQPANNCIRNHK